MSIEVNENKIIFKRDFEATVEEIFDATVCDKYYGGYDYF